MEEREKERISMIPSVYSVQLSGRRLHEAEVEADEEEQMTREQVRQLEY